MVWRGGIRKISASAASGNKMAVGSVNVTTGALWALNDGTPANGEALGTISTTAVASSFGAILVNNTGQTLTTFTLSYTGEQWYQGATLDTTPLSFFYQVGGTSLTGTVASLGSEINVPSLGFTPPNSGTSGSEDGTLAANQVPVNGTVSGVSWAPGQTLVIYWNKGTGVSGGNGLGIANVSFSAAGGAAPTITSAASASFVSGTGGNFTVTDTGSPTPTLAETVTLPSGVTFTPATGVLAVGATAANGVYNLTFTANNGVGSQASQSFTLTVGTPPTITSATYASFVSGTGGNFTVTDTGSPTPTLAETVLLPSGITFTPATAVLAVGASAANGVYNLTFTANNGVGSQASQSFTLAVGTPPAITSATSVSYVGGTGGNFTVTDTGSPTPTLAETVSLPSGVTFTPATGVLAVGATAAKGVYNLTFTANNGVGSQASQGFTLNVGTPPAITSATSVSYVGGIGGNFTVTDTGSPTPTLAETATLPSGVTFTPATGVLAVSASATNGVYNLTFTANNGVGSQASQGFTLNVGTPPAITSATSVSYVGGTGGNFTLTDTGSPTPTLAETVSLPSGVTFTPATGVLAVGASTANGMYNLTFTANNGVGSQASQSFTLTVGTPPAITSATSVSYVGGTGGNFTVTDTGSPTPTQAETVTLPSGITFTPATGVLAVGASATDGVYNLTFTANNGVGSQASQSFTLTVGTPPAITSATSVSYVGGIGGNFTVTDTGSPTPTLAETATLPGGVTFTPGTGVLAVGATAANGVYNLTFTANNGVGSQASQSFTLTVGTPPAITSANSVSYVGGTGGNFAVTDTGSPTPSLAETATLPSGVTFTPATGVLAVSTTAANGVYPLTFTANNGVGSQASQSFTLTVGTPPAITSANSVSYVGGIGGNFTVTDTGSPTPTLAETAILPSGVTFTPATGVLAVGATAANGVYNLTFTANNGVGSQASQSFTLTVGTPPAITSANSVSYVGGTGGNFTVTDTGSPTPTLAATATLPSGVTFTPATGVLAVSTTAANGVYPLTFTANNGVGSQASQSFTLTVGTPPAITSANSVSYVGGIGGNFTVTDTGSPTPTLAETVTLPSGVTFTPATGVLAVGASAADGVYNLTFTANDGVGSQASQSFTLTVGTPPAITSATSVSYVGGIGGNFTVTDTGSPTPTLAETAILPSGVTFTPGTGVLAVGATAANGVYNLAFTANNGVGSQASQSFTLTVGTPPAITSANSVSYVGGIGGNFTVTDTGSPTPTLAETVTLPSGVTFTPATGVLAVGASAANGVYNLTFTANNGVGSQASQIFTLTVGTPPAITSATSVSYIGGTGGNFTVTDPGSPTPTLAETVTLPQRRYVLLRQPASSKLARRQPTVCTT